MFYLSLLDQEGCCLSGFYVSPASSMFWTPALFKNKKLSGKEEEIKTEVQKIAKEFKMVIGKNIPHTLRY